jgi:F420-0:gamma-glutamyl ligase-like protein
MAFAVLPYGALPASKDAAVVRMAHLIREERAKQSGSGAAASAKEALATYRVFVRNLVFYTGTAHTDIINDQHLLDWLRGRPSALLVIPAADVVRLERLGPLSVRRLAELRHFDDASMRVRTLMWPDPERDLETVVLARISTVTH